MFLRSVRQAPHKDVAAAVPIRVEGEQGPVWRDVAVEFVSGIVGQSFGLTAVDRDTKNVGSAIEVGVVNEPSPAKRAYMGDPRGHWDRDALVVETTNFQSDLTYMPSSLRIAFRGVDSATLRLVERFMPVNGTTTEWSVTIDDSSTWPSPWTFAMKPHARRGHPATL